MSSINNKDAVLLAKEHSEVVAPGNKAKFEKAVLTKNPLALSTFEERGISIEAKLDRIRGNKEYQKLDPKAQARVRAGLYDKYVVPSYTGFHLPAPTKDEWVAMTAMDHNKYGNRTGANTYADTDLEYAVSRGFYQADKALMGVGLFGTKVANKTFQKLHGLQDVFSEFLPMNHQLSNEQNKTNALDKLNQRLENHFKAHTESDNFWLQTHPRDSLLGDLGGLSGEIIATLPLYEAIGGNLKSVAAPLTTKLAATSIGKYVGKVLIGATDGYLSSLAVSGGNKSDAALGGVAGAGLGAAGEVAGKIASYPLIKKWTASILAMAGKPFAQDLAASAYHEELADLHTIETLRYKVGDTTKFGHGISITPSSETSGYISFAGVKHPYATAEERQAVYNKVQTLQQQTRMVEDPVVEKLHAAEKKTQVSVAMQLYGKPLRNLSKAQRERVFNKRLELINQAAIEAPVHLPEMQKAEIQHNISDQIATEPQLGEWFSKIQKDHGGEISDAVTQNTIQSIAVDTGIVDAKAVQNNLRKPVQMQDRSASFGPKDLAELRNDAIAYFKNPSKGVRRASDGTIIGARDKRTWNDILKADNLKEFVETLKDVDQDKIKFESPMHRMLFHWSNRKSFTPELRSKFLREMRKIKGQELLKTADFDALADWNLVHLNELAKSGRLVGEGNIYASTKLGPPMDVNGKPFWTKYQFQLANENDADQMQLIEKQLKRHPKVLAGVKAGIKILSDAKYNTQDPEEFLALDKMFRDTADSIAIGVDRKTGIIGIKGEN